MDNQSADSLSVPPDGRPPGEQPRWRQDFPIDWPADEYLTRREFTKFLMLTSGAFVAGQFFLIAHNQLRGEPAPARTGDRPGRRRTGRRVAAV